MAIVALTALGLWLLGALALRLVGVLLVVSGLAGANAGQAFGLFVAALGALAWIAGHYLYGVRHNAFASPLARRLFTQTPLRRADPTRGWGIPTAEEPGRLGRRSAG